MAKDDYEQRQRAAARYWARAAMATLFAHGHLAGGAIRSREQLIKEAVADADAMLSALGDPPPGA